MPSAPIAVCRISDLTEAGAFFTQDVEGTPVLVTRDVHGTIRALVNLCRHRGARLVHEKQGVTKSFTCILHGWTYDAAGDMGGSPLARLAKDNPMLAAIRTTSSLTPLPSELRHGFVWVMPSPRASIDVASFLGPLDAELTTRGVEDYVLRERTETAVSEVAETTRFVFHEDAVSLYTLCRRRAETDFGEGTSHREDALTLSAMHLEPRRG